MTDWTKILLPMWYQQAIKWHASFLPCPSKEVKGQGYVHFDCEYLRDGGKWGTSYKLYQQGRAMYIYIYIYI